MPDLHDRYRRLRCRSVTSSPKFPGERVQADLWIGKKQIRALANTCTARGNSVLVAIAYADSIAPAAAKAHDDAHFC